MSGIGKRTSDKLNSVTIVVIGLCAVAGAYASVLALQSFYMSDTADVQTMADYGGQDKTFQSVKANQKEAIAKYVNTMGTPTSPKGTHKVPIERAMELVVEGAKVDASNLVPAIGPAVTATREPTFGRSKPRSAPAPVAPAPAPVAPAAAGSAAATPEAGGNGR